MVWWPGWDATFHTWWLIYSEFFCPALSIQNIWSDVRLSSCVVYVCRVMGPWGWRWRWAGLWSCPPFGKGCSYFLFQQTRLFLIYPLPGDSRGHLTCRLYQIVVSFVVFSSPRVLRLGQEWNLQIKNSEKLALTMLLQTPPSMPPEECWVFK